MRPLLAAVALLTLAAAGPALPSDRAAVSARYCEGLVSVMAARPDSFRILRPATVEPGGTGTFWNYPAEFHLARTAFSAAAGNDLLATPHIALCRFAFFTGGPLATEPPAIAYFSIDGDAADHARLVQMRDYLKLLD